MTHALLIPLLCCTILIVILLIILNRRNKVLEKVILEKHDLEVLRKDELKTYFKEEWDKEKNELDNLIRFKRESINNESIKLESNFKIQQAELNGQLNQLESRLKEKEKRYKEVNQDLDTYRKGKIKEIDNASAEYEKRKRLENAQAIEEHNSAMKKASAELQEQLRRSEEVLKEEIKTIQTELDEERAKRAAINEEILRARAVEEQQDFYRIQLDPNDKDDVEILRATAPRLRHPEAINKVIWTGYYQKPLAELRKRLLPNGDISCVYKATRIKTGEIYIGQTTSFDKRLQDHTRSALGIGTLASSQLHRKMLEDGPENYLWEILEETPKDKLRERESYYIDFYDSKTYGLNSISGDKQK